MHLARLWADVGGDPAQLERVALEGPASVLPSVYDVTGWAAATIAVARLAAAELLGDAGDIVVDREHAAAAFVAEALFEPVGWSRPSGWDPLAGDYPAADGWVRLHTNYPWHRDAARWALDLAAEDVTAEDVTRATVGRPAVDVESDVVARGGCAAAMHERAGWASHHHGRVAVREPVVSLHDIGPGLPRSGDRVRVLDLTRVIAGPECTRFLAATGMDVLRLDPPGFDDLPALLPETTAGKRCAFLDLRREQDRFDALVAEADVVVCGLRPGAVDADALRSANPGLVVARLDAYGWDGPWRGRRGFDSLVQMSTGIAARGMQVYGTGRPTPLRAQALDHGAGFALAAGVCRALTRLRTDGIVSEVRASLVGAANELCVEEVEDPDARVAGWPSPALYEPITTAWGPARRIRPVAGTLDVGPGPLGRHEAVWEG